MTEDEIQEFFENLSPDQFVRSTSATVTERYKTPRCGPEAFDSFVDRIMSMALNAWGESDTGKINPIGILHTSDECRIFEPEHDETVKHFYQRLRREADAMGATWFATAMVAPSSTRPVDVDQRDQESIEMAKARGELDYNLCWHAESIEPGFHKVRCGLWPIAENGELEALVEGTETSAPLLFKSVLHPEITF